MGTDCPFAALGLSPDASRSEIKRAFRARARRNHPDVGGDRSEFERIHRAYAQLRDHRSDPYRTMMRSLHTAMAIDLRESRGGGVTAGHARPHASAGTAVPQQPSPTALAFAAVLANARDRLAS